MRIGSRAALTAAPASVQSSGVRVSPSPRYSPCITSWSVTAGAPIERRRRYAAAGAARGDPAEAPKPATILGAKAVKTAVWTRPKKSARASAAMTEERSASPSAPATSDVDVLVSGSPKSFAIE